MKIQGDQGGIQNHYVTGYLQFWDDLRAAHPGMLIDNCCGGGKRLDLESLRRAVCLLRSDHQKPNRPKFGDQVDEDNQGHTWGITPWIPYWGSGAYADDIYSARSHMGPSCGTGLKKLDPPDVAKQQKVLADYYRIFDLYYGDFYPLTDYTVAPDAWMAYSWVRPDHGDGMVLAFRHPKSPDASITVRPRGLDPSATYRFTNLDPPASPATFHATGADLTTKGLTIALPQPRSSVIYVFQREGDH